MEEVKMLPLSSLRPSPANTFRPLDEDELQALADSIREHGFIHPVVVRPVPDGCYEIVSGEQRSRAARLLGLEQVPCVIRELTDEEAEAMLIDANLRTRSLNPMEIARAVRRRKELLGVKRGRPREKSATIADLSDSTGMSERTLRMYDSLNNLIPELQELVASGSLNVTLASKLASLPPDAQKATWQALGESVAALSLEEVSRLRRENDRGHSVLTSLLEELRSARKELEVLRRAHGDKEDLEREIERLRREKTELERDILDRENAAASWDKRLSKANIALLETVERLGKLVRAEEPNLRSWLEGGVPPAVAAHLLKWARVFIDTGTLLERHAKASLSTEKEVLTYAKTSC